MARTSSAEVTAAPEIPGAAVTSARPSRRRSRWRKRIELTVLIGPVFHLSLTHNVIIAVLSVLIQLPLSIALALMLNRRFRGRAFLRIVVFAPYVLYKATAAVMW